MQNTTAEFGEYAAMMNKTARKHVEAADKTVTAVEALFSRIDQIEAPNDLLEKKLAPLIAELSVAVQQTVERGKKEEERIVSMKALIDADVQLTNLLQRNIEAIESDRGSFQHGVNDSLDKIKTTITDLQTTSSTFQHGVNDNLDKIKTTITDLQTTSSTLLTDWGATTRDHFSRLDELMQALERASGMLVQSWEERANALHTLVRSSEQDLTAVREHREALEAELEKSRNLVGTVHSSLASMTDLIVERLNGN